MVSDLVIDKDTIENWSGADHGDAGEIFVEVLRLMCGLTSLVVLVECGDRGGDEDRLIVDATRRVLRRSMRTTVEARLDARKKRQLLTFPEQLKTRSVYSPIPFRRARTVSMSTEGAGEPGVGSVNRAAVSFDQCGDLAYANMSSNAEVN